MIRLNLTGLHSNDKLLAFVILHLGGKQYSIVGLPPDAAAGDLSLWGKEP